MISNIDRERYSRHLVLKGVGESGQEKLKNASVLIIGAGGLGSPVSLYLAAAGVGRIGIVDCDEVDISNLQRQILYGESDLGKPKASTAGEKLLQNNPRLKVEVYNEKIDENNISDLVKKYDFIVDCVDNFETKFLINDVCVQERKPFCHAGVIEFHGQVMTYVPGKGPCYRCIFEEVPKEGDVPENSEVGVMGAMVGIIGTIQALEAIKYIIGSDDLLTGQLLVVDGLTMEFRKVKFSKPRENCMACGRK